MAITTIFPEQTIEGFRREEAYGMFAKNISPPPFALTVGEEYTVVWDETEWNVVAQDTGSILPGTVSAGNLVSYGLSGNNEPFVVVSTSSDITFFANDEKESHRIAIYQGAEEETGGGGETEPGTGGDSTEEETPEGIVLKDRNGNNVTYYGIETVTFDTTTEGKQQTYTKGVAVEDLEIVPDFSGGDMPIYAPDGTLVKSATIKKPETLAPENVRNGVEVGGVSGTFIGDTEESTVELSMADGDQVISPSADGKVLSKVTVKKPETLIPENIAEGVDIAGIIGTLAAGGGGKIASGTMAETGGVQTVEHNLGVVPDVVYMWLTLGSGDRVNRALGCSEAFCNMITPQYQVRPNFYQIAGTSPSYVFAGIDANTSGPGIHNANETTFTVGSTTYPLPSGYRPCWVAIGGLT